MASPALVVRGAVRIVALMATRQQPSADDLRPRDLAAWKALRRRTETRHEAGRVQACFRRNPYAYLAT